MCVCVGFRFCFFCFVFLYSWLVCWWCRCVFCSAATLLLAFFYLIFYSFICVWYRMSWRFQWYSLWQCAPSPVTHWYVTISIKWTRKWEKSVNAKCINQPFEIWTIKSIKMETDSWIKRPIYSVAGKGNLLRVFTAIGFGFDSALFVSQIKTIVMPSVRHSDNNSVVVVYVAPIQAIKINCIQFLFWSERSFIWSVDERNVSRLLISIFFSLFQSANRTTHSVI